MFAVPPPPKSLAVSTFDQSTHQHGQSHSHSHSHQLPSPRSLQLPKLEATPPSPPHLPPLQSSHPSSSSMSGGNSMTGSRQWNQPMSSSGKDQRRRRMAAAPASIQGYQRGMHSPLPPPHPHPYAHGQIHTSPAFYARSPISNGNGHAQKQLHNGNQHEHHGPSNGHQSHAAYLHPDSGPSPSGNGHESPGLGPTRTANGAQYRRSSAAHAHAALAHAAKLRAQAKGQSNGAMHAETQHSESLYAHSSPVSHPTVSHHGLHGQNTRPGVPGSGATGEHGVRHLVAPSPNLPSVHRLGTVPSGSDSPTLPAINTSHSPPGRSSPMSGPSSSPNIQAHRMVRPTQNGNATASGSGAGTPVSSAPRVTAPRSIRQASASEAGSVTDNDVTPTPSVAGTPSSAGVSFDQVPRAFVLQRLQQMAGTFWNNPRSSDVFLVVPDQSQTPKSDGGQRSAATSPHPGPGTPTRRYPQPTDSIKQDEGGSSKVPAMSYAVHRDYLIPQSSLLRTVLCDGLPKGSPELKGCQVLPFSSLHGPRPIWVPVPDPESFAVLVHWMYWGDVAAVESALNSGTINWRGMVANIEYLGLDDRTKRVVGRWWRRWARAEERANRGFDADADTDDDDDNDDDDEDDLHTPWGDATAAAASGRPGSGADHASGPLRAGVVANRGNSRRPAAGSPAATAMTHATGLGIAQPHPHGRSLGPSRHYHARNGLDLLATASEREYDADEMSKRLGLL